MMNRSWLLDTWLKQWCKLAFRLRTQVWGSDGFSVCVFEVSGHVYTQQCVKSCWVVWSVVHLISTCWPKWFTALTEQQSWGVKQASVKANTKHSSEPANKLSPGRKRERGKEYKLSQPSSSLSVSLEQTHQHREVRTQWTDKLSLHFSYLTWDKTCLTCLTRRDSLP